jgi:hypothetical protein
MRLFSCKVRLGASLLNEVPKIGVTASEIALLRILHSPKTDDGALDMGVVADIKPHGDVDRSDQDERKRLQDMYGAALKKRNLTIGSVFGIGVALPSTVEGVEEGSVVVAAPAEMKRAPGRPRKDALAGETLEAAG